MFLLNISPNDQTSTIILRNTFVFYSSRVFHARYSSTCCHDDGWFLIPVECKRAAQSFYTLHLSSEVPSSDVSVTCFGETLATEVVVGKDRFGTGPERHLHCRWHVVLFRGVVIPNHGTEKEEHSLEFCHSSQV